MEVKIYADGSCLGNGKTKNFGGYGIVIVVNGQTYKTYKEGFKDTTNNIMELRGMLKAVQLAKALDTPVSIYCDSAYVVNTVNEWMFSWAANSWIRSNKRPPENLEIIKELYSLLNFETNIAVIKTKGHADDEFNNEADRLAVAASTEMQLNYLKTLAKK